jgi:hypothetical protein
MVHAARGLEKIEGAIRRVVVRHTDYQVGGCFFTLVMESVEEADSTEH